MKKKLKKATGRVINGADIIVDIQQRTIIMSGGINRMTVAAFQKALFEMQNESLEEIVVRICRGNGGCAISSMMIYGLLRACFAPTRCVVEKRAYSGSLLVLQGASKRIIKRKAHLKFHWANVEFAQSIHYDIKEVGQLLIYLLKMNDGMYKIMNERTGLPVETIKSFFAEGAIIRPTKALKLSLVDKII